MNRDVETRSDVPGLMRGLAIAGVAGVFLAASGAFSAAAGGGIAQRMVYWLPIMIVGALYGHVVGVALNRVVSLDDRPWLHATLMSLCLSAPLTVGVWAFTGLMFTGGFYPVARLWGFLAPVACVTVIMSLMNVFLANRVVQTHADIKSASPPRFLDRLPPKLRGAKLIAVEAEDHYLRLHTDRGTDLILMRLSDAVDELQGLEGAQVHRSWWVAKDAVRDVRRGDGRATLTLESDVKAPVSRRYARGLRAAGWW